MPRARQFQVDPRRVVHETIDDETILVNLQTGAYYSLKGSGPDIWALLVAGCSEDDVVGELRRRHPNDGGTVARSTLALIEQLRADGLLEEVPANGSDAPPAPERATVSGRFEPPVCERYTDMENFIRMDPIHDVGDGGWPQPRPAGPTR